MGLFKRGIKKVGQKVRQRLTNWSERRRRRAELKGGLNEFFSAVQQSRTIADSLYNNTKENQTLGEALRYPRGEGYARAYFEDDIKNRREENLQYRTALENLEKVPLQTLKSVFERMQNLHRQLLAIEKFQEAAKNRRLRIPKAYRNATEFRSLFNLFGHHTKPELQRHLEDVRYLLDNAIRNKNKR